MRESGGLYSILADKAKGGVNDEPVSHQKAVRGARVTYTGDRRWGAQTGTVVGSRGDYLLIRMDGETGALIAAEIDRISRCQTEGVDKPR